MVTAESSEDRCISVTLPMCGEVTLPASVGRFVVLHPIGAGGMGVVVAAYDPLLDRRVALKVLRARDGSHDASLVREAQAMARLAHGNVVAVHEAGTADGRMYLAMELIDGGTLHSWLAGAPRTWREIRDRFVEAGAGLVAAHDAGLVHRDFKPDNVVVGRDGRARVTDFGLVRVTPGAVGDGGGATTEAAGTPHYMAPEQHDGQRADPRADQFAFCVALYEALWQTDPFAAPDPAARRARVLRGDVVAPSPGDVPAWMAAAVVRGLAADPARRHPTMQALLDLLVRESDTVRTRRRPPLLLIGGAGVAAAIAAVVMLRGDVATTLVVRAACEGVHGADEAPSDDPPLPGAGPEIGRSIAIGLGAAADGGGRDAWFDNLRVTSSPLGR